jgi:hypothetical protein
MTFEAYETVLAAYKAGSYEGDQKKYVAEKLKDYERSQVDAGREVPAGGLCV